MVAGVVVVWFLFWVVSIFFGVVLCFFVWVLGFGLVLFLVWLLWSGWYCVGGMCIVFFLSVIVWVVEGFVGCVGLGLGFGFGFWG